MKSSHLAAVLSFEAAPYLCPEFVGRVVGILNVAYGYACGTNSLPPAQDANLTPLIGQAAA